MNQKEFFNNIKIDPLAKTDDSVKTILKIYLDVKLRGGKIREPMLLYGLSRMTLRPLSPEAVAIDIKYQQIQMWKYLQKAIKEGQWTVENNQVDRYDNNGKLIDEFDYEESEKAIISKIVETTIKTTCFMEGDGDIKLMKRGRA